MSLQDTESEEFNPDTLNSFLTLSIMYIMRSSILTNIALFPHIDVNNIDVNNIDVNNIDIGSEKMIRSVLKRPPCRYYIYYIYIFIYLFIS